MQPLCFIKKAFFNKILVNVPEMIRKVRKRAQKKLFIRMHDLEGLKISCA